MIKKIILIMISLFFCMNFIYAGFYNSSYTNLYLDRNGWCAGMEINFHIYNKTDYNNKNEIEKKLCDVEDKCDVNECALDANRNKDKCDECRNCNYYNIVKNSKIIIYDGPMDSRPILYETKSGSGDFSYTFNNWNGYLIEVIPEEDKNGNKKQHYNDYSEILEIQECANTPQPVKENQFKNQNYNYLNSQVEIELTNTSINDSSEIAVRDDVIIANKLNNTVKTLAVTSKNKEFTNLKLKFQYNNNLNGETHLYKYNDKTLVWEEVKNFETENEYIVLNSAELGIYSITQTGEEIVEEPILNEINETNVDTVENTSSQETTNNEEIVSEVVESDSSKIGIVQIGIGILVIMLISLILYFKFGNKKNDLSDLTEKEKTVLTTYDQTYQETSKYVQKYKDEYSQDQLYRALKDSGVPADIIDKVFKEEL